ncbi:aromatic amino acid transport family protein [Aquella oligotrophica]|uniref:Amino acid permease n=1 Tax=Aquella oligotrophica TaxID=2067065 RepID=A0A2I7N976_9NEIS|nr:aromatic amino acid transport family protein [Aquella oligotrophica]AUR53002.1 hypothetical protein CUN60_12105 [Aquella oligotrophica]
MGDFKRLLLSSFMVAGAAIGSGVLALPILASGPGIVNTFIFISITFIVAFLMAGVSIDVYASYDNHNVNAATLAVDYFGKKGYWLTAILNVLSMGSLAAAYVNAGGDLLVKTVLPIFNIHIPSQIGMIIFFLVFMPAFVIGLGFISRLNGVIFTIKFTLLIGGIILGLHLVNPQIFEFIPSGVKYLGAGASTMFCIWMMHMVLPLVLKINHWNPAKAKKAVLVGMIIPALAYVGWMMLIFSLVPRAKFVDLATIGDIMHFALTKPGVPSIISTMVGGFAAITVLTAFLSIGFALVAFVIDALKWKETAITRFGATLMAFLIPVIIALLFPKAFVVIYQQSNMFQIGAALIPVAASIIYKKKLKKAIIMEIIMLLIGFALITAQVLDDLSIFPSYGGSHVVAVA